jgi:hypothetical protein
MVHTQRQARQVFASLICIELLLVTAYATDAWVQGPRGELHAFIDLDGEGNLPTWFSSFQLALIAVCFWCLAARSRATQLPSRRFLRSCSAFFLLLSTDETAMIHERITAELGSRYLDWIPGYLLSHPFNAIVCVAVAVGCATAVYPQFRALYQKNPAATRIIFAGCLIYLAGGAVLESIGYKMLASGSSPSLYRLEVACEEFLEMLGASFILYGVLAASVIHLPVRQSIGRAASGNPD